MNKAGFHSGLFVHRDGGSQGMILNPTVTATVALGKRFWISICQCTVHGGSSWQVCSKERTFRGQGQSLVLDSLSSKSVDSYRSDNWAE